MADPTPQILLIAGPDGAGKSSAAAKYLPAGMTFINADEIAKDLPGYPSASADMQAGRIALEMMDEFEHRRDSSAFETTLASRSLANRITRLRGSDYHFHLVFFWSPSAEFCFQRVLSRVRAGGHDIPEATIRRRYSAGLRNFFRVYRPVADIWTVIENNSLAGPQLIATGRACGTEMVLDLDLWTTILGGQFDEPE